MRPARLLGAAARARESAGAPLPQAERGDVGRITAGLRATLGTETCAAEYSTGCAAGVDDDPA
ncbi:hypothetical protein [Streptomyces sp. CB03238]|uniref:hypothetical protein n=1 Tax=Streptomyces sp. CB03238 TaxID=1907777 RepID=UPI000A0FB5A1|nr:hypothetical protein [Streptomyces sp. CB03238]ORT60908.1 hypothetical protein BKD26_06830 [Streptomyces sp. CB03238]